MSFCSLVQTGPVIRGSHISPSKRSDSQPRSSCRHSQRSIVRNRPKDPDSRSRNHQQSRCTEKARCLHYRPKPFHFWASSVKALAATRTLVGSFCPISAAQRVQLLIKMWGLSRLFPRFHAVKKALAPVAKLVQLVSNLYPQRLPRRGSLDLLTCHQGPHFLSCKTGRKGIIGPSKGLGLLSFEISAWYAESKRYGNKANRKGFFKG